MVLDLQRSGWPRSSALRGGFKAWQSYGLPLEPRGTPHTFDEKLLI
ncbi:hypothetical protein [Dictyobacter alpinus]|nr:hypothetical protein [Dictyobacter alpinus]